ncbi:serine/threonine protein kinase [Rhodopirellula rubra]|uniref:Serine/threonine protein kinase n=1 Tax=Aporhodopirellula rubra TaxID=980271 RepID=A0A7W5DYY9_9BACT|nr:serine/threonine-protein kinase [Aporhodopirellula rubra]MBB3207090.1 serine/threonine protein kinase [Aporhodopirellula rubra]
MKRIGPYEVIRELGHGAFGRVYLARNTESSDPVAIKIAHHANDRRVLAEGRSLIQLNHPGIVSMLEVGSDGDLHYLVSEYTTGPNLETALQSPSFDWIQSVRIVIAVAEALSHAHAHRVIRRDIKPANIILVEPDRPVLVDFDLAVDETSGAENLKGDFAGTLAYMSPEQVIGEGHRLDGRTDIYSLGVVLYRMLTGRLPFHCDDAAELKRQIREDDPQPPRQLVPNLPMDLDSICVQTLSKDYPDRQTTAGDLATQLRGLLGTVRWPGFRGPRESLN